MSRISFVFKNLCLLIIGLGLFSSAIASDINTNLAPVLKKIMPAVVNIHIVGKIPEGQNPFAAPNPYAPKNPLKGKFVALGSGVIINAAKGYILTNNHVIADAVSITVTLKDGRQFKAKLVGGDKATDLAVIQIHAKNLKQIQFANSNQLQVGNFVAAIGSPFGLNQTVTTGIVSALHRNHVPIEKYENFIQTDAPINPGNSGGALVNLKGQLVGINTAIVTPTNRGSVGIGFAIPSNMAKIVANQLIKYKKIKRGMLGVYVQTVTPQLANAFSESNTKGAVVTSVIPNSPAAKMGLKPGDIITKLNGDKVQSSGQIHTDLGILRMGSEITMSVLRNNKTLDFSTQTESPKLFAIKDLSQSPFLSGVNLEPYKQLDSHKIIKGLLVTAVKPDTQASFGGLLPGDIILSANQQKITNLNQLEKIIKTNQTQTLLLNILRGKGGLFIVIKSASAPVVG